MGRSLSVVGTGWRSGRCRREIHCDPEPRVAIYPSDELLQPFGVKHRRTVTDVDGRSDLITTLKFVTSTDDVERVGCP